MREREGNGTAPATVRSMDQQGRKEKRMSKLIALATLAAFGSLASPAFAAGEHSQQTRMKECNVKAKGKKGDERRQFMSACLSGKEDPVAKKVVAPKK
jgi:hypothetical protein